ncbi:MAG: hypothetical protein JW789_04590 [Candidatus Aenigmarchaeota archaeon]|nr:hypothetical protein [Candidatus Aenigmarchaeota archaeon]
MVEYRKLNITGREISIAPFSGGFVMIPESDVSLNDGGYIPGFVDGNRQFCYHCKGPVRENRKHILYMDVTAD